jgi:manganese/zinc/iron transport system substrate-binding protein
MKKLLLALVAFFGLVRCTPEAPIQVLATTSVVADAARQLLPDEVEVVALMQSDIDPHSYKPVESDVAKLQSAEVILHNGLHLEGKMTDILEKLGERKPVYAMSNPLEPTELIEVGPNTYDPHIWFDLQLWSACVSELSLFLMDQFPEHRETIQQNATNYFSELVTAHDEMIRAISEVPDSLRAMVTAHDAFSYFGRAYGIEVRGLQGISTAAEFGVSDMRSSATFIIEKQLNTVFTETSVNPKSIQALQEAVEQMGGEVVIGAPLFSDALGAPGTPEATLIGAFKHNTTQVLKSFE